MTQFFLRIYDMLSRHQKASVFLVVVLFLGLAGLTLHVKYEEDISKFLPRDELDEKYAAVYQAITRQDQVAVVFSSRDTARVVPIDSLEEAMSFFGEQLDKLHIVKGLQVQVDEDAVLRMLTFMGQNYPYFLKEEDYVRIDRLLRDPSYIRWQLEEDKKTLMLPMGGVAMQTLRYDPLHLFSPALNRLQSLQPNHQYVVDDGYVFTKDGKYSLITFSTPYGSSETYKNADLLEKINHLMEATEKAYPNLHISVIGAPFIAVTNAQQIKKDSMIAISISIVLILILLFRHYQRRTDLLWIAVSIFFGWLFALAGMAVFKDSVSIIVLGIGSVIIGISVNYPLHFIDHVRELSSDPEAQDPIQRTALKEMVPPLLIGNITTVAAFLCLVWLDAQAMRDLGVFGSLMLIGTILFVLVFLPLFIKVKRIQASASTTAGVSVLDDSHRRHTGKIIWAVVLLTLVLGYFSLQTSFDSNLSHINFMTADQKQNIQLLSPAMQGSSVFVVAEGKNLGDALRKYQRFVSPVLKEIKKEGLAIKVTGISDFILSEEQQRKACERWHAFWQEKQEQVAFLKTFQEECQRQGFSADAFQPFLELVTAMPKPRPLTYFKPITDPMGSHFMLRQGEEARIVSYVQVDDQHEDSIKAMVRGKCASVYAFSSKDISNQLVDVLNDSFNYIGFVCGFVVFFFLWVSFGRIELSLLSFLPLAVGWIWILGIMQIFGQQFNIVNIILATFIFGQGDDYTIFITEGLIYEYAYGRKRLASYKKSVALSALIMFIGIGTLSFAKHPALRSLGIVTVIGMATVVLMANYLPPIVFRWITMKKDRVRLIPLTLKNLWYSVFSLSFFVSFVYLFVMPLSSLYFLIGKVTEKKRVNYHRFLCWMARFIITKIPGVRFQLENPTGEDFQKPAIIVANHQSHLDIVCLMIMHPKMIFLTNHWAYTNHFYGKLIQRAEFLPASDGLEAHLDDLRSLYQRGYSICIFPEGTRSTDFRVHRFHKGAFYLAELLHADIVPVVLHGVGHVLPKVDFLLREGTMYAEILPRLQAGCQDMGDGYRAVTKNMQHLFQDKYQQLCQHLETSHYWAQQVKYQYMYKGTEVERRCHRNLKKNDDYAAIIDAPAARGLQEVHFEDVGQGELPYLYALVHPETQVYASVCGDDDYRLLMNMANLPVNLHFTKGLHVSSKEEERKEGQA